MGARDAARAGAAHGRHTKSFNSLKNHVRFDPYGDALSLPGGRPLVRVYGDVEHSLLLRITIGQAAYLLVSLLAFTLSARPWRRLGQPRATHGQRVRIG